MITLDLLRGSQRYTIVNLKSGYYQVVLYPEDKEKMALSTGTGLKHSQPCLVYLDDAVIFGRYGESEVGIYQVPETGLKLSPKRCSLVKKKKLLLGTHDFRKRH